MLSAIRAQIHSRLLIVGALAALPFLAVGLALALPMGNAGSLPILLVFALAAALVAAIWMAVDRLILRSLDPLFASAEAVERGEAPQRVSDAMGGGAFGTLARAHDTLVEQLEDRQRALTLSEAQAARARDRLTEVVDALADAIVLFDQDDSLVFFNARFREILPALAQRIRPGMSFAEVCRISAECGQFAGAQSRVDAWVAERMEQRRYPDRAFERMAGDRWLRMRERATRTGGTIGVYADISEIRSTTEMFDARIAELQASRDQMEAQTRQLTALTESYAEARRQAEYADRAKSEFLARMSHELRTPLNVIIGFADVMHGGMFGPLGSPRYGEYVNDIRSSGRHLLTVVNDILDLSKIEAGQFELSETTVDLAGVITGCLRFVHERAQKEKIELVTEIDANLPSVTADERALKQIMVNLLTNAVKFTGTNGKVTAFARLTETGEAALGVSDTGVGMTADEIPIALRPFGQTSSSKFANNEGTGLGLPLVKSMVELHGGRLDIVSERGVGTTVTAVLPASRVPQALAHAV
jgi:two-component system cell cycle sensor histidine kinase PleC